MSSLAGVSAGKHLALTPYAQEPQTTCLELSGADHEPHCAPTAFCKQLLTHLPFHCHVPAGTNCGGSAAAAQVLLLPAQHELAGHLQKPRGGLTLRGMYCRGGRLLQGSSRACWRQLEAGLSFAGLHSSSSIGSSSSWMRGCSAADAAAGCGVAVHQQLLLLPLLVVVPVDNAISAGCLLHRFCWQLV